MRRNDKDVARPWAWLEVYNAARMPNPSRKPKVFWGWWIVAAVSAGNAIGSLAYIYGFGAFLLPVSSELGLSRTGISGVVSAVSVLGGLISPLVGFLTDRLGPRVLGLPGVVLLGMAYLALSRVDSTSTLYLVYLLGISIWFMTAFSAAPFVVITNWFSKKRGLAMGLAMSGVGVGGLAVPLVTLAISSFGWRATAVIFGGVIIALAGPFAYFMRHRPEQYGLLPDGATAPPSKPQAKGSAPPGGPEFTLGEAFRTRAFWALAVAFGLRNLVQTGALVHIIATFTVVGYSVQQAAAFVSLLSLFGIAGRFASGWLGDYFSKRWALVACMALSGLALLALMRPGNVWLASAAVAVFGAAEGGAIVLHFAIRADYFGRTAYGTIGGWTQAITTLGSVVGPLLAGAIYDGTGSYLFAYLAMGVLALGGAVLYAIATPPRKRTGTSTAVAR